MIIFALLLSWSESPGLRAYQEGRCAEAAAAFAVTVRAEPESAVAHHNLASSLFACGRYAEAEGHYRQALALPLADAARAVTHNNLAVLLRNRAQTAEARREALAAIALEDRAQFWQTLAEVERFAGDLAAARRALDQALERRPDRWLMAAIRQTRGVLELEAGEVQAAVVDLEAAVEMFRTEAGPTHVRTLLAETALAGGWSAAGRLDEAGALLTGNLRQTEQALGSEHPRVATAANNLAQVRRQQKRYEEADPLYRKAIAAWERSLGAGHPDVARGWHNLASMFAEQGKLNGAEKLYRRAWEIAERSLGAKHPQTVLHRTALESLYLAVGRKGALEQLRRGLVKTENQ